MTTALSTGIRRVATRLAPDPALTSDGELLARFLASRDEAAFAAVVRRHAPMVFGTCRRVLGNAADADDAFQAAFVVLVRKAESLTDRACVGNFLYGVAFHTALKAKAMATKRRAREARANTPQPTSMDGELTAILDEELARLPEKYREPVVLCELEGVSRRDAAGRLGVPEGTISSRLATAHRMLEKRLRARGFAAVAITAVLGKQALAVSDTLADAAVRAAVAGPPTGIAHLAKEVTKMFLLNKLRTGAAVLAGVALLLGAGAGLVQRGTAADDKQAVKAPVPAKQAEKKDEDLLQGLWQAESLEAEGQKAPDEAVKQFQIRFKGADVTFVSDDRTHTFELDATAKPKALNLTAGDGEKKGKKLECAIYDLDGDTLKVCIDKEGEHGKRPTEFKTAPKDGLALMVLRRVKEEKKDAPKKERPADATRILGRWVSHRVVIDPPPMNVVAVPQHVWTFDEAGLHTEATVRADRYTGDSRYELNPAANPKGLTVTGKGVKLLCIYELDGDTLKVAMYGMAEKARPSAFAVADDTPKGAGPLTVIEFRREDKEYALKDGEVLKLIPAPFPEERAAVYAQRKSDIEPHRWLMVLACDGTGCREFGGTSREFKQFPRPGLPLGEPTGRPLRGLVEQALRFDPSFALDPDDLLATMVDADVLVRPKAKPEQLAAALQTALREACRIDLTLEIKEVEREVVVLSGKSSFRGGTFQTPNFIDLYADTPLPKPDKTIDTGASALPSVLGQFIARPVIDESDLKSKPGVIVGLRHHLRTPATAETRAEDCDPAKVLKNLEAQTGLTFKLEKRKVRSLVVAKADEPKAKPPEKEAKKADEPAWKDEFRKAYGLTDGQLIRRVAPPYPDCREEYFKAQWPGRQGNIPFDQWFAVFGWKGEWTQDGAGGYTMPVKADEGVTLERLLDMTLKFPKTRIEADQTSLERKVTGDFVVRTGADPEKAAGQLEAILRKELELPVRFAFTDAEEEVFVLSGKYAAKPLADRKADQIEVYAGHLTDRKTGGGGSGTLKEMAEAVERHVGKPVVLGQVEGNPAKVEWHYNSRSPATRQEYAEDRDAPKVLFNVAEQTGLTVTPEKRKVRVLVVEHVEVKK